MNTIKKYLNTFKGNSESQGIRRFGFNILSLLFVLLFSLLFAVQKTFDNQFLAIIVDMLCGYSIVLVLDLIVGIERKSPIFK